MLPGSILMRSSESNSIPPSAERNATDLGIREPPSSTYDSTGLQFSLFLKTVQVVEIDLAPRQENKLVQKKLLACSTMVKNVNDDQIVSHYASTLSENPAS
jgi:hypothetical protein